MGNIAPTLWHATPQSHAPRGLNSAMELMVNRTLIMQGHSPGRRGQIWVSFWWASRKSKDSFRYSGSILITTGPPLSRFPVLESPPLLRIRFPFLPCQSSCFSLPGWAKSKGKTKPPLAPEASASADMWASIVALPGFCQSCSSSGGKWHLNPGRKSKV